MYKSPDRNCGVYIFNKHAPSIYLLWSKYKKWYLSYKWEHPWRWELQVAITNISARNQTLILRKTSAHNHWAILLVQNLKKKNHMFFFFYFPFVENRVSLYSPSVLKLPGWPWTQKLACLCLLGIGIKGMWHHGQAKCVFLTTQGFKNKKQKQKTSDIFRCIKLASTKSSINILWVLPPTR